MRNLIIFLFSLMALGTFARQTLAEPLTRYDAATDTCRVLNEGPLEWSSLAWGEGGKNFKRVCQGCHFKGNDKGAPFLWTESKSSTAWNRVFAQRYPKCAKDGSWNSLNREQLMEVNDYLYRWAKNSQNPFVSC